MNLKKLLTEFAVAFAVTLVVSLIVTYLWNLILHQAGKLEWETSFRFAIILGVVLSWMMSREGKRKEKG